MKDSPELVNYSVRLLDDCAAHVGSGQSLRSFQPRFDWKENKNNYELQGEFLGFEQKNINI